MKQTDEAERTGIFVEGLEWCVIPWVHTEVRGEVIFKEKYRNEVTNPPCNGSQRAFVMRREDGVSIFCPFSFQSFKLSPNAMEVMAARNVDDLFRQDYVTEMMIRNWSACQRHKTPGADFDMAAVVMTKLGIDVPTVKGELSETEEGVRRGGAPAAPKLIQRTKKESKRGRFLAWFVEKPDARSVRACMAQFEMTRQAVTSMWKRISADTGIGYTLVGDTIAVHIPEGSTARTVFKK